MNTELSNEYELLLAKKAFDHFPIHIVLVDNKLNIIKHNHSINELLSININDNIRFGNALKCINSIKSKRGCGFSKECKKCKMRKLILQTFKEQRIYKNVVVDYKLINGAEFSFNITTIPITIQDREYVLIYLDDITEERKREISILNLNNFLLNILDSEILWIELADKDGTILLWGKLCEALTGYKAEEVVGNKKLNFFHPSFKIEDNDVLINQTIENKNSLKEKEVYLEKKTIKDYNDSIVGFLIMGNDISAVAEFKSKFYKQNKFLNSLLQNIPTIILVLNKDLEIISINKFGSDITGYSIYDIKGQSIKKFFVFDDKNKKFKKEFKPNISYENFIKTRDGGEILVSWKYSYVKNDKRKIDSIIITAEDITEKREFERKMMTIQKMESIGRLSGGLAHDFNNILTTIINSGELILRDINNDFKYKDDLKLIIETAKKGSKITRQLLGFSRQQIITPRLINLNKFIKDLKRLLEKTIGENIDLSLKLSNYLNLIKIDETQLEQIIINLCINAKDAVGSTGKIVIETYNIYLTEEYIQHHPEMKKGDFVVLSISDNGTGIDKDIIDHIFEPFFSTKSRYKGTGLGLAMVYGIVKQNNGFIYVYSEPNLGATVKIYFPAVKDNKVNKEIIDANKIIKKQQIKNLKGSAKILVVEDETSVRKVVEKVLKANGYEVFVAANPSVAINIIKEKNKNYFDLLITDIIMPMMNGVKLYEKISKFNKNIKVLYMSGYSDKILSEDNVISEDINFIQKPFNIDDLLIKIKEILAEEK